jgi:hypothetical protein
MVNTNSSCVLYLWIHFSNNDGDDDNNDDISNSSNNNNNNKLVDKEQSYHWLKFGDIKGETELWQLRIRQSAQTTLREKFLKKKLKVDVDYVNNTKKLLTT